MPVMMVRKATSASEAIVGVASGAMVRNPVVDNNGAKMGGYEATGGVADAGAYLSVVVQGLVQAKVSGATALQTGDWITLEGGDVRWLPLTKSSVARVMSETDADGLAWVMFNGR